MAPNSSPAYAGEANLPPWLLQTQVETLKFWRWFNSITKFCMFLSEGKICKLTTVADTFMTASRMQIFFFFKFPKIENSLDRSAVYDGSKGVG